MGLRAPAEAEVPNWDLLGDGVRRDDGLDSHGADGRGGDVREVTRARPGRPTAPNEQESR
jgi:hypothetical protein